MNTSHYHKQLIPLMQGIKVLSISKGNISKTKISSPQTIAEQEKISRFLYLLDQRATAQSKIIDALKKYKRGVVRSLLSPEHCGLKEVQWQCDTIGNLGFFIKGAPLSKADISETGTPFILYGELYTTYHEVITSVVRKTEALLLDWQDKADRASHLQAVLFSFFETTWAAKGKVPRDTAYICRKSH